MLAACTERGDCPVTEFLSSVGPQMESSATAMLTLLDYVAAYGPPRNVEISHQLQGDIYEFIKGRLRVLYFLERSCVVCTHGFVKKSRKVKNAELCRAESVRRAYHAAAAVGNLKILEGD